MAKLDVLAPFIFSYEGVYGNDPVDRGGATKYGVTIGTWKMQGYDKDRDGDIDVDDLKAITLDDAKMIMRKNFWNKWQADAIKDQSIANCLVDWVWASGVYGIKIPQAKLGVLADGVVGPKTIAALNRQNPKEFFAWLKDRRREYLQKFVQNQPKQKKFLRGWLRRLDSIKYGSLVYSNGKEVRF